MAAGGLSHSARQLRQSARPGAYPGTGPCSLDRLGRLPPPDQLAAAVLPGRLPEAGLEDPGEVGDVLETPAPGDRLHPALGQRRVLEVTAAVVQPAFPHPAGD